MRLVLAAELLSRAGRRARPAGQAALGEPSFSQAFQFTRCAGTAAGRIQHPHRLARGVRRGLWQKRQGGPYSARRWWYTTWNSVSLSPVIWRYASSASCCRSPNGTPASAERNDITNWYSSSVNIGISRRHRQQYSKRIRAPAEILCKASRECNCIHEFSILSK